MSASQPNPGRSRRTLPTIRQRPPSSSASSTTRPRCPTRAGRGRTGRTEVARAARQPATSGWRLSSPALGTWLLLGVGGAGAALLAVGRWAWKWRKVALQLIPGIQQFLDTGGDGASQLQTALSASTDKDVKVAIDTAKRDLAQ